MKHFLVVVDMQRDFVNGSLGTAEADAMIPQAVEKIRSFDGDIFVTYDTHFTDYLKSAEGKKLPVPHCILGTPGWELDDRITKALEGKPITRVQKYTFGSDELPDRILGKAAEEAGMELARENGDLRVENMMLRSEIEQLTNDAHAERLRGEGEG